MPSLTRLLGWAPPTEADYIDVAVPDHLGYPHHQYADADYTQMQRRSNNHFAPSSPASSTSAYSDTEKSPGPSGKKGDPHWVARPRNEFILFRCDYVRRHTREATGKRTRRAPGQESEKTLSKLAAEAWRALTPDERIYWREQANIERDDHARKYPDYRYRPKKSATGRKRQSRISMAPSTMSKSSPAPALLATVTIDASGRSSPDGSPMRSVEFPPTMPMRSPLRKTASTPYLSSGGPMGPPSHQTWGSPSLPPSAFGPRNGVLHYDYGRNAHTSARLPSSFESCGVATPALSESMSVQNSTSSSLVNWNAEGLLPVSSPQSNQYIQPLSLSLIDPALLPFSPQKPGHSAVTSGLPVLQPTVNALRYPSTSNIQSYTPGFLSLTSSVAESMFLSNNSAPSVGVMLDMYGMPCHNETLTTTINPSEYFASSAEMTPDEMFVMDQDEYFPSGF